MNSGLSALILYELAHSNRAFFNHMTDIKRLKSNDSPLQVPGLKLFSSFLSFSSFIFLHLKDSNAISYGRLCLIILQYETFTSPSSFPMSIQVFCRVGRCKQFATRYKAEPPCRCVS